ncbi:MAG: hypothetical protein J6X38_04375 [Abditibacteriota bacterium]|nr:hypothetical protein [Abditibacteriota bacterium]
MRKYIPVLLIAAALAVSPLWAKNKDRIVVTDYGVANDGKTDVSDAIQRVIDKHPNRTIYFPDGTYLISKSICTPADPKKSVDLRLSNYAVIKAAPDWSSPEAMIRLGGKDPFNSIKINGSNYGLTGGVIDGNVERMCDREVVGVSIDSGRETFIKDASIKHVKLGIRIKWGANGGSSDADIRDVNIVGTCVPDAVGVIIEGGDNTLTNMRIADVYTGVHIKNGGGDSLYNIHPLFCYWWGRRTPAYEKSVGFKIDGGSHTLIYCYSDQFSTGFEFVDTFASNCMMSNCFCFWYNYDEGVPHTAIHAKGKFMTGITDFTVGYGSTKPLNTLLLEDEPGGGGAVKNLRTNAAYLNNKEHEAYEKYLTGTVCGYN